jgi:hypothetical protein
VAGPGRPIKRCLAWACFQNVPNRNDRLSRPKLHRAVIAGGVGIKIGAAFCIAFREIVELLELESKKRKIDSGSSPE